MSNKTNKNQNVQYHATLDLLNEIVSELTAQGYLCALSTSKELDDNLQVRVKYVCKFVQKKVSSPLDRREHHGILLPYRFLKSEVKVILTRGCTKKERAYDE